MSKFAKIDEEVYRRQDELTGEEFRLYCIIFFHTFVDSGICRRSLRQLALIYKLNYTHTTERFKILLMDFSNLDEKEKEKRRQKIKSPWCKKIKGGIRPLIGLNVPKNGTLESEIFRKAEHQYSENRNTDIPESGIFGEEMFRFSEHTYKEYTEPLKSRDFSDNNNKPDANIVDVVEGQNSGSKFSLDECRRYVSISVRAGQTVKNPEGLAITLHKTGEYDAFIEAALYPIEAATAELVERQIEYDDEYFPTAMDEAERTAALAVLRGIKDAPPETLAYLATQYTTEDWQWLSEELQK